MKKNTPKRPNKRRKKTKELQENIIILGIFIVFIAVVAYLFYFVNIQSFNENIVAIVNGDEITRDDLDWWYKASVLPEYRDLVTKPDFLVLSLIPQEILLQEAKKNGIKATKDEVEKFMGLSIIENGLTLDEFEDHLESRGLTIEDTKKSFETRTIIIKLLEKENIVSANDNDLFFDENDLVFQEYLSNLINRSKIELFPENIAKLVLRSFKATDDEACDEEKPIIRLYTTTKCQACNSNAKIFKNLIKGSTEDKKITAMHWSLDTGDNLLTSEKENGIPQEEVAIFKKYSPKKLVPAVVLGCKYKYVGELGAEEQDEFKAILKKLTGG